MKIISSQIFETLPHLLVVLSISLIDFIVIIRARLAKSKYYNIKKWRKEYKNYSILVPIFGNISYLKNIKFLKKYGDRVILCATTKETQEFNKKIRRIANEYKFKIFRSDVKLSSIKTKPNPWKLFKNTLHNEGVVEINKEMARDEIIKDSLNSFETIQTQYCVFLDGDTTARGNIDKLVGIMKESDFDIISVRVLASKKRTLMEKLQSVEYELAMDARKIYPWLTSGACMVAKTSVIKNIMSHHSLFFSGGDIEIGKLSKMLKYKVGHIPFKFYTDVPPTFKTWFKQRMAWFGGGVRHSIINIHRYTWRHPLFYFYTTFLVYGLVFLRWYEVIKRPFILFFIIVLYWVLILSFHWKNKKWFYFLFPFYALIQVMILVVLGMYMYIKMAIRANSIGFIKLRHKEKLLSKFYILEYLKSLKNNFLFVLKQPKISKYFSLFHSWFVSWFI